MNQILQMYSCFIERKLYKYDDDPLLCIGWWVPPLSSAAFADPQVSASSFLFFFFKEDKKIQNILFVVGKKSAIIV